MRAINENKLNQQPTLLTALQLIKQGILAEAEAVILVCRIFWPRR